MSNTRKKVLLAGSRTAIGKMGGSLMRIPADKLTEHVQRFAMSRAGLCPTQIDGVIFGQAYQDSGAPNIARFAWLNAGFPANTPGHTIHIQCGSGMKAVNDAMDQISLGHGDVYVAGGVESMSTIPYAVRGTLRFDGFMAERFKFGPRPYAGLIEDGLVPRHLMKDTKSVYMAGTAERVAEMYGITREQMDAYSVRSQTLALAAQASGRFALEIDPVLTDRGPFLKDEHPRKTDLQKLAKLKGVNGTRNITAGNSSGLNDAACALVVASEDYANKHGLAPLATLVDHCVVGVDPDQMGIGPVAAATKLLNRNSLTLADIDLFELNEAFAGQVLACAKLLVLDLNKLNVNGGAVALGHPIAMSGARVILTLAHELRIRRLKRGMALLCIGGGMGIATLVENPEYGSPRLDV